jgi:hypothetical protein
MDQIYTITTDNGANMLKAIKVLSSDYSESDEAKENSRANVDDVDLLLDQQLELDKPTEESEENESEDDAENILQVIENSLDSNFSSSILTGAMF